jgi:hypothetical protein
LGTTKCTYGGYGALDFTDSLHGWAQHIFNIAATIDGGGPVTQITNSNEQIAKGYKLFQNFPNPFNPFTSIKYQLSKSSNVKLIIYNIAGKEIKILVNEEKSPGTYEVQFDGNNLSSGVYFYTLFINGMKVDTKKAVHLK